MALIVAVHGVGQQFKGDAVLFRDWWPALCSGMHLVNSDLKDESDFVCAFYGHLFRKPGSLSQTETYKAKDVSSEEGKLLALLWRAAAEAEPERVHSPEDLAADKSLVRWPQMVQRALNALAKSTFWANVSQSLLIGDVKQLVRYLDEPDLHEQILDTVLDKITENTKVVIGHSLGSVVAYEALCRKTGHHVSSFVSLGSPLGIRNLVFDKLRPSPDALGIGVWPGVRDWTNVADKGDIVAIQKQLAPLFGDKVKDVLVNNGSDAHHGERYLTTREVGEAVRKGVWEEGS